MVLFFTKEPLFFIYIIYMRKRERENFNTIFIQATPIRVDFLLLISTFANLWFCFLFKSRFFIYIIYAKNAKEDLARFFIRPQVPFQRVLLKKPIALSKIAKHGEKSKQKPAKKTPCSSVFRQSRMFSNRNSLFDAISPVTKKKQPFK